MGRLLLLGLGMFVGAGLSIQAGANSQLRQFIGSAFRAGFVNFTVGGVLLAIIVLVMGGQPTALRQTEWWMWIGGLCGAAFVLGSVFLAPRLGAGSLAAALVAGQLIAAVIIDQFGLLGYRAVPISWTRVVGLLLLLTGVILVQRGR